MEWYLKVFKQYADFSTRARRKEYWMFTLINFLITIFLAVAEGAVGTNGVILILYYLLLIVPSFAVAVRRLHDIGKSGWWLLINLIPLIGGLIMLFLLCQDSEPDTNYYGPNPKAVEI